MAPGTAYFDTGGYVPGLVLREDPGAIALLYGPTLRWHVFRVCRNGPRRDGRRRTCMVTGQLILSPLAWRERRGRWVGEVGMALLGGPWPD